MDKIIRYADSVGMMASTICLIHCLILPFILIALPLSISHIFTASDTVFHQTIIVMTGIPGVLALIPGFKIHHKYSIVLQGLVGISLFALAVFLVEPHYGEKAETVVAVIGSVILFTAHYRNRTACQCCPIEDRNTLFLLDQCNCVARINHEKCLASVITKDQAWNKSAPNSL